MDLLAGRRELARKEPPSGCGEMQADGPGASEQPSSSIELQDDRTPIPGGQM
jgi:hypothetical protein